MGRLGPHGWVVSVNARGRTTKHLWCMWSQRTAESCMVPAGAKKALWAIWWQRFLLLFLLRSEKQGFRHILWNHGGFFPRNIWIFFLTGTVHQGPEKLLPKAVHLNITNCIAPHKYSTIASGTSQCDFSGSSLWHQWHLPVMFHNSCYKPSDECFSHDLCDGFSLH